MNFHAIDGMFLKSEVPWRAIHFSNPVVDTPIRRANSSLVIFNRCMASFTNSPWAKGASSSKSALSTNRGQSRSAVTLPAPKLMTTGSS